VTRVLLLCADWAPGSWSGLGVAAARQARALAELGLEVDVRVARDGLRETTGFDGRLRVARLPRTSFDWSGPAPDVIHVHGLRLAELALELRARWDRPLVATVHGWPDLEMPWSAVAAAWSRVQQRVLRACDAVVCLSRSELALLRQRVPQSSTRAVVVPHGLPPSSPPGAGPRERLVLFAGRVTHSKGAPLLADIVPRVAGRDAPAFIVAGGHGDEAGRRDLSELSRRWPHAVRVTGWLEATELASLYRRAALVLVPSRYEPFGLVALEAQAHGAPVLASDVGGLRDVVAAGSGGQRVASHDPDAWVEAITALLRDDERWLDLARRGPAWVAARFSAESAARCLVEQAYGRALRASPPAERIGA
jgi:glycosyltransferase involved in cell wall biosynthesis